MDEKNTMNEAQTVPNEPLVKPALPKQNPLLILLGLIIIVLLGLTGFLAYQNMQIRNQMSKTNTIVSTASSVDLKTYTNRTFSIQYPSNWIISEGDSLPGWSSSVVIYNPHTMTQQCGNGGCNGLQIPTEQVSISFQLSSQLPKQYVDTLAQQTSPDALKLVFNQERKTTTISNIPAEEYPDTGEGSNGNNFILSNGKILVSIHQLSTNTTNTNQILSTFQFTTPISQTDTSNWKTYIDSTNTFSVKYPTPWSIFSTIMNISPSDSLASWVTAKDNRMGLTPISRKTETINSHEAVIQEVSAEPEGRSMKLYIRFDQNSVIFITAFPAGENDPSKPSFSSQILNQFDQIISTFQFTN